MIKKLDEFSGTDLEKICKAAEFLRTHSHSTLYINPGVYNITGKEEKQLYRDIISTKYGDNPQPFTLNRNFRYSRLLDLDGAVDVKVIADGALFMIDGFFEPVSIRNCRDVEIRGLSIDWLRKPYSRAKVIETFFEGDMNCLRVVFRENDMPDKFVTLRTACYNPKTGILDFALFYIKEIRRETNNIFVLGLTNNAPIDIVGCDLYIWHFYHSRPAVLLQNAENVVLKDIFIHSNPGMGITAHLCENITLEGVSIVPSRGDRVSTDTDATHFVSCRGKLDIHGCAFDGNGDDAVNVHTYYHSYEPLGDGRYKLACMAADGTHTAAADLPRIGDELCLAKRGTLDNGDRFKVLECLDNEDGTFTVKLSAELPNKDDYYLTNDSASPEFIFSNCKVSNNYARGVLIKTKKADVFDSLFVNTHLTAVSASAEEGWGEGIPPQDVKIHDNVFVNCARHGGQATAVAVFTDSKSGKGEQIDKVYIYRNKVISDGEKPDFYVNNVKNPHLEDNTSIHLDNKK